MHTPSGLLWRVRMSICAACTPEMTLSETPISLLLCSRRWALGVGGSEKLGGGVMTIQHKEVIRSGMSASP